MGQDGGQGADGTSRFETLDALRGVCALMVAFFHMPFAHPLRAVPHFDNVQFCVDVFFVLSGFVLLHAYGERLAGSRQDLRRRGLWRQGLRFALVRFGRLWPLHAATLGLLVAIEAARLLYLAGHPGMPVVTPPFGEAHRPIEVLTHLLFLQDFLTFGEFSWNVPAWSIAVEFYASLVLAGTVMLVGPRAHRTFAVLALLSALALHAASPGTLFAIQDWGILRCLSDLFVGCLAYGLRDALRLPEAWAGWVEAAALALLLAVAALVPPGGWAYGAPLVFGAVIALFSHGRGPVSAAAQGAVPQALGRWSFSIYLLHFPVLQLFRTGLHYAVPGAGAPTPGAEGGGIDLGAPLLNLSAALALVGVSVLLAGPSYWLIERPALAWFRALDRWAFARTPAAPGLGMPASQPMSQPVSQIEKPPHRPACGDWSPIGQ
nr:acyltransferase [Methylobacterium radiodurans]